MSIEDDVSEHGSERSVSPLHRSPNTLDLSKLAKPPSTRANRQSISFAADHPENHDSESADVLYMAPSKRSKRRSLSTVNNHASRYFDGSDELELKANNEQLSLSIIDREISEWQHICKTGRPSWCLPETRYTRAKTLNPWLADDEPNPRVWFRELNNGAEPEYIYANKRRAVSDSYLNDPTALDELAHMIAIQLLSSCFTLSPDPMLGIPPPTLTTFNKQGHPTLPNPRMVSSLRMHTYFRYSPCFGHQPRNPSPVQTWAGAYDGSTHAASPSSSIQTPIIGASVSASRRRRGHRIHNVMEDSMLNTESDWSSRGGSEDLGTPAPTTNWYRRRVIGNVNGPRKSGRISKRRPATIAPLSPQDGSGEYIDYHGSMKPSRFQKMNYRLHPIIRSEPHPLFVQPVKELVVKRWKSLRRRFGGSLHGALPTNTSEISAASESGVSSPGISSDAGSRRQRAQERGEIYSNSVESTPHYDFPISGVLSLVGGATSPYWVDSKMTHPRLHLADPFVAALNFSDHVVPAAPANLSDTANANEILKPSLSEVASPSHLTHPYSVDSTLEDAIIPQASFMLPKPSITATIHPTSRKSKANERRKSMLSEMHMAEEFESDEETDFSLFDRSALSAAGSALVSSGDSSPEIKLQRILETSGARKEMPSASIQKRLRMSRTSTSGTQVFYPAEEGVEIDGLPVGPSRHAWDGKGEQRERTYL